MLVRFQSLDYFTSLLKYGQLSQRLDTFSLLATLKYMNYKTLIAEAWKYTQSRKKLILWYGFLPSIFTTTAGILYVLYQFFSIKQSPLFENAEHSFLYDVSMFAWDIVQSSGAYMVPLIVSTVVVLIMYLLLPTFCQGGAIQIIARHRNGQKVGISEGVKYGFMPFLKLFEYHILIKSFGIVAIVGEMAFVLRNLGLETFYLLMPLFVVIFLIGLLLSLLFAYADMFIIIDNEGVMSSIKKSTKLVVMNWQHTFLITILMLIIGVRIILQVFIVLAVPGLIFLVGGYLAITSIPYLTFILATLVGVIALLLAAYLAGVVNIFAYAVWTYTFLSLVEKKELSAREKDSGGGGDAGGHPPARPQHGGQPAHG